MQQVSIPTLKDVIHHVAVRQRNPLFIWGASGIGKTDAVEQVCADQGGVLCDIRLSQYESVDFRGLPDITPGEQVTKWLLPSMMPFKGNPAFVNNGKPIFLFLDEINQGQPSVLSTCYQLLNEGRVGEHELLDNVVMVAAGNRDEDKGTTNRWPKPLGNRGTHVEATTSVDGWVQWAGKAGKPAELLGFMQFRPELIHTHDPKSADKVFASPRTWSMAGDYLADKEMPDYIKWISIAGSVGDGPGAELNAFIGLMADLPNIRAVLADPNGVPIPHESDKQWAAATMISGYMKNDDNLRKLQVYLSRLEAEMVPVAWTTAIARDDSIIESDTFIYDYSPRYRALFSR